METTVATMMLLAAGGAVIAGAIAVVVQRRKQQAEAIRQLAARMGWNFREAVPFSGIPGLDRFELFRQGRRRELHNIMTSPAGDPRLVLFDYSYTTGGGRSQSRHTQTVCYATADRLDVPSFSLRPEHFFHRVAGILGYQDIDLDRHPTFSDAFLLRGDDARAVRDAFSDDVVAFFDRHHGTCAAGAGHELLFWRANRRLPPDAREALIAETVDLVERFTATGRAR
jgi:hypothetical protein